ncbi:MAG TPA: BMP family ABC transporter substrate-binding protein [Acidimicrobiales bacterium]|nr:BMP family ABC transporter substrate-binding protein [Acidimicrobiales bacterium]
MKTRKFAFAKLLLSTGVIASLLTGTVSVPAQAAVPFKAAWIYVGPHNDGGWSQAHDNGRLYVQKMLGSAVQTTYKENIAVGTQFNETVASLAAQGYKMIFATSYGYITPQLAAKYPNILFEQATGTLVAKNVSEYFGAAEDTIFLSGMAAGAASKTGKIGFVVAYPIPEVIRHTNAFTLGAQLTHPGATVRIVWTHSWFDPAGERKAAQSLYSAGVDVLGQNVDSPATGQFAQSVGIPWVGYDSDSSSFAPKSWLAASVYNWGPYYLRRIKEAMAGTWKPGFYYGSINDGFTQLAPFGPGVSASTRALIATYEKRIENGSFYEFTGPLYDQSGKLRVPKGQRMQVLNGGTNSLYGMNWLVKGVIGSPTG